MWVDHQSRGPVVLIGGLQARLLGGETVVKR